MRRRFLADAPWSMIVLAANPGSHGPRFTVHYGAGAGYSPCDHGRTRMDPVHAILLDALRTAARQPGELRLYRSGKLPGLMPARTAAHVEAATQAVRDGLIEGIRTETRGKTAVEFVRITPRGVDFVLRHNSPARAMDELRDALALNVQELPAWIAELRQELDTLSRRMLDEVTRIGQRLDRLAAHVEAVLQKAAAENRDATAPWTQ